MVFEEYDGAMFSTKWRTSERKYNVVAERDVKIPISDGVTLSCDVFRPDTNEKFPAILGFHPYHQSGQTAQMKSTLGSSAQYRHPGQSNKICAGYHHQG